MADALTTRYGIVKPEVGASADTWGTKENLGIDDLDALLGVIVTTGAADAYVLTTGLSLAAYVDGQSFLLRANFTNTGAATINVDALGPKALTKRGATALAANDVVSGRIYRIGYDGTQFQVLAGLEPTDITFAQISAAARATAAEFWANTASKLLTANGIWSAADPVTITFSATQTLNFATFVNGKITLTANTVLQTPTNRKKGQSGCIELIQDATGSRTMDSANVAFVWAGGVDGVLSTAANARDLLFYQILDDDIVYLTLQKAVA